MVLGVVSSDGKVRPLIFIPEGLKFTRVIHRDLLIEHVIPRIYRTLRRAPAHTAMTTEEWSSERIEFWEKGLRPPSSPDLNLSGLVLVGRSEEVKHHISSKLGISEDRHGIPSPILKTPISHQEN